MKQRVPVSGQQQALQSPFAGLDFRASGRSRGRTSGTGEAAGWKIVFRKEKAAEAERRLW